MSDYDEVPYPSITIRPTNPAWIGVAAVLRGLPAPDPQHCRVLEIGCSDAGNLIALASRAPGSTFVGVELSGPAVDRAKARIESWGVRNVEVRCADLRDSDSEHGSFDLVIAHGVHSWVSHEAAEALMESVARHLAPGGIAYVSYNTLPGSHLRSMVGESVRLLTDHVPLPRRVAAARVWLSLIAATEVDTAHARILREIAVESHAKPDKLLLHDDLADTTAMFFTDFVTQARRVGLDYLGEADLAASQPPGADDALLDRLAALGEIERQQLMDILSNRSFRQTLLVHADEAPTDYLIVAARLNQLWAAAPCTELEDEDGRESLSLLGGVRVTTDDALLLDDLRRLGAAWPGCLAVSSLTADRAALFRLYESRAIELWVQPIAAVRPGERPRVSDLVRRQAAAGDALSSLRHEPVLADDPVVRAAISLFDGEHDRAEIIASLRVNPLVPTSSDVPTDLERLIDELAGASLFLA